LFREARRLERRRRQRYAAATLLACAIAGGGGFLIANDAGGAGAKSGDHPLSPLVSSLKLPQKGDYFALAVVDGRVIVSGGPTGSQFPSGSTTSLSDGRAVGTCDSATVEPGTLELGHIMHANCGDPALYDERVLAVSSLAQPVSRTRGLGEFGVRIAHVDPGARDGYTLGPVVMTYPQCSDCSAQWIYGDGSLWLYAAYHGGLSRSYGELLRVSGATGNVVEHWAIPQNPRELLAVNADGLWFAPSIEGGYPLHTSASQRISYQSLYRVTPGARTPVRVLTIRPGGAYWLVAAVHTVWLETRGGVLWRIQGSNGTPTMLGRYPANGNEGADIGETPATHAGNAAIGVYFVSSSGFYSGVSAPEQIVRLSADAAKQQTVAQVPAPPEGDSYAEAPPAVALDRSFYFLDPPLLDYRAGDKTPIVQGQGILYRVTPKLATRTK
jgi:hypothetical protein